MSSARSLFVNAPTMMRPVSSQTPALSFRHGSPFAAAWAGPLEVSCAMAASGLVGLGAAPALLDLAGAEDARRAFAWVPPTMSLA